MLYFSLAVGMGVNMTMTLNPNGIGGLNPLMGAAGPGSNPSNMPVQPGMGIMAMMASATQPSMAGVGMGPNAMAGAGASPAATAQSSPSPHNGAMSQNGTPLSQNGTGCRKHSFAVPGQPPGHGASGPASPTAATNQILVPTTLAPSGSGGCGPGDNIEGQQAGKAKNEETCDTTVNIVDRTYF